MPTNPAGWENGQVLMTGYSGVPMWVDATHEFYAISYDGKLCKNCKARRTLGAALLMVETCELHRFLTKILED